MHQFVTFGVQRWKASSLDCVSSGCGGGLVDLLHRYHILQGYRVIVEQLSMTITKRASRFDRESEK